MNQSKEVDKIVRSVFFPHLVAGPKGDPALYVRLAHRREAILFDCGDLGALPPREMSKIAAVFISHTHVDHFIDFDRLVRFFLYTDHRLAVFGPAGLTEQLGNRLASYTWNLVDGFPFEIVAHEWNGQTLFKTRFRARNEFRAEPVESVPCEDGRLRQTSAYHVTAIPLTHGDITSLAFCLEEVLHVAIHKDGLQRHRYEPGHWLTEFKDALRADIDRTIDVPLADGRVKQVDVRHLATQIAHTEPGMKVCYVTDVGPTDDNLEAIAQFACDAHMIAIEAVFAHRDLDRARERNHLTATLAGQTARRANAARALFFHFSPRYQEADIDLQSEAEAAFQGKEPDQVMAADNDIDRRQSDRQGPGRDSVS